MTKQEADFIGSMNMCDEISNEAYKKIMCNCEVEEQQPCEDVLDKIKAEILEKFDNCNICEWFENYDYDENDISEYMSVGSILDIIDIIDKYRK